MVSGSSAGAVMVFTVSNRKNSSVCMGVFLPVCGRELFSRCNSHAIHYTHTARACGGHLRKMDDKMDGHKWN